jgi:hypothetical protein
MTAAMGMGLSRDCIDGKIACNLQSCNGPPWAWSYFVSFVTRTDTKQWPTNGESRIQLGSATAAVGVLRRVAAE